MGRYHKRTFMEEKIKDNNHSYDDISEMKNRTGHYSFMELVIIAVLFIIMFAIALVIFSPFILKILYEKDDIMAHAQTGKEFKWTKQAMEEGITVNAGYLWPDESDPVFMAVYRDGSAMADEDMVTIAPGSVYHFWGTSDGSILYTQVYTENAQAAGSVTQDETGTWYRLLPSAVRSDFENSGWTWTRASGQTGSVYLDLENQCVVMENDDPAAILYGVGLFMDYKYDYAEDVAFEQESGIFENVFGDTDNLFAESLECYYTRGGELENACPMIYSAVKQILSR